MQLYSTRMVGIDMTMAAMAMDTETGIYTSCHQALHGFILEHSMYLVVALWSLSCIVCFVLSVYLILGKPSKPGCVT